MGHLAAWSHGAPVPWHRTLPKNHLGQSMCQSPRIGNQDTQCTPSKMTPPKAPFPRRNGGGPAAHCNIFGAPGMVIRYG